MDASTFLSTISIQYINTYSQLYNSESPILTVKHVASFKQYQAAYAGGHLYVWNVMFGLGVGVGGRGFGVVRLEQASENEIETKN